MKFSEAWADMAKQNITYKTMTLVLGFSSLVFCYSTLRLSLKRPLVIERACETKAVAPGNNTATQKEIREFIRKALSQRFNTNERGFYLLSKKEKKIRNLEQKGLSQKNIIQDIFIREIGFDKKKIQVNADRIFAVGQVRSNFPIKMFLDIKFQKRNFTNPYGLILNKVIPIQKSEGQNE